MTSHLINQLEKATTNTTSLSKRPRNRDWLVRHIPVMVKGRSPRQYRVPKLISSVVMAVCLYLAVHLNRPRVSIVIVVTLAFQSQSELLSHFEVGGTLISAP